MCLLLPVGFVIAFDTLYQSVLFVICFDNKTAGVLLDASVL